MFEDKFDGVETGKVKGQDKTVFILIAHSNFKKTESSNRFFNGCLTARELGRSLSSQFPRGQTAKIA